MCLNRQSVGSSFLFFCDTSRKPLHLKLISRHRANVNIIRNFVIVKDKSKDAHIFKIILYDDYYGANIRSSNYNSIFFIFIILPQTLTIDQFFIHFPKKVWCPNFFQHAGTANPNAIHHILYVIEGYIYRTNTTQMNE